MKEAAFFWLSNQSEQTVLDPIGHVLFVNSEELADTQAEGAQDETEGHRSYEF